MAKCTRNEDRYFRKIEKANEPCLIINDAFSVFETAEFP